MAQPSPTPNFSKFSLRNEVPLFQIPRCSADILVLETTFGRVNHFRIIFDLQMIDAHARESISEMTHRNYSY